MATKKEFNKVYIVLAVLLLLILVVCKRNEKAKVPSGVFKDTEIVDLHYKVFSPIPPENSEEDDKSLDDPWDQEQRRRQALLAKVCKENEGKTHMELDPDRCKKCDFCSGPELNFRFMYDDNSNTLWCDVAKCGSTTYVFTVFKELYTRAGFKIEVSPKMRGSQTAIRQILQGHFLMNSTNNMVEVLEKKPFTFAVVRHPFQRLVSAYLDFKTRSRNSENEAGKLATGSFTQFLRNSVLKNNYSCSHGGCASVNNHHWRSMDKSCSFCAINYTVISTMETFAEDYARISERLGLTRVKAERSNVHGGSKIEKLTAEHFKEVPEGVKQKLREIYEYDLKLFGYQDNI